MSQRQLGILKYLEHLSIDLEHERDELSNTPASRQANELIQEQRGRAAMLILVRNCDSHLSAVPARRHANEARDSYQSFAVFFSNRQHEADVIAEIELGQASEGVGCKRRKSDERTADRRAAGPSAAGRPCASGTRRANRRSRIGPRGRSIAYSPRSRRGCGDDADRSANGPPL